MPDAELALEFLVQLGEMGDAVTVEWPKGQSMRVAAVVSEGSDLAALALFVGALYLPRHGRRDLTAAYIGVNIGVLAVTLLLSTASVGAGLGLGLFGVLSIIRLRSTEISQGEIALEEVIENV